MPFIDATTSLRWYRYFFADTPFFDYAGFSIILLSDYFSSIDMTRCHWCLLPPAFFHYRFSSFFFFHFFIISSLRFFASSDAFRLRRHWLDYAAWAGFISTLIWLFWILFFISLLIDYFRRHFLLLHDYFLHFLISFSPFRLILIFHWLSLIFHIDCIISLSLSFTLISLIFSLFLSDFSSSSSIFFHWYWLIGFSFITPFLFHWCHFFDFLRLPFRFITLRLAFIIFTAFVLLVFSGFFFSPIFDVSPLISVTFCWLVFHWLRHYDIIMFRRCHISLSLSFFAFRFRWWFRRWYFCWYFFDIITPHFIFDFFFSIFLLFRSLY